VPAIEALWKQLKRHLRFEGACWLFTGYRQPSGHGRIRIGGRRGRLVQAHRLAYMLTHGPVPAGLVVRHLCGNAACCNPLHLTLGTQHDNVADAILDGTHCRWGRRGDFEY
jgi:hypothetical protein